MELSWPDFKGIVIAKDLRIQSLTVQGNYYLKAFDGFFEVSCTIPHSDPASLDQLDFEEHYAALCNKAVVLNQAVLPDPAGYRFRGHRMFAEIIPPGEHNLDWTDHYPLYLTGLMFKAYGSGQFDYAKFQVVNPASGAILEEFVEDWAVSDDLQNIQLYKAFIPPGVIIRIVYFNSNKTSNVSFWVNGYMHAKHENNT